MTTFMRRVVAVLAVGIAPSVANATWTLSVTCTGTSACGPLNNTQAVPGFSTQQECETARASAQCQAVCSGPCAPCSVTGQTSSCTEVGGTGGSGGGGGGEQPQANLPGSEFFPPGSLLTDSILEQFAGGLYGLGDLSLLGTDYGDAFFTPHYLRSTEDWMKQFEERLRLFLQNNAELMGSGKFSVYGNSGQNLTPYQALFENQVLRMFMDRTRPDWDPSLLAMSKDRAKLAEEFKRTADPAVKKRLDELDQKIEGTERELLKQQLVKEGKSPAEAEKYLHDMDAYKNNLGNKPAHADVSDTDFKAAQSRDGGQESWDNFLYSKASKTFNPYEPPPGASMTKKEYAEIVDAAARETYDSRGYDKTYDQLTPDQKRAWAVVARMGVEYDNLDAGSKKNLQKAWVLEERYNTSLYRSQNDPESQRALAEAAKSGQGADVSLSSTKGGTQSHYDCVLYAMANATGEPYTVTSTIAMEKVKNNPSRDPEYRDNPALAVADPNKTKDGKGGGLMIEEIVQVGNAIGRTEIVRKEDIEKTLIEHGKPVYVGIDTGDGGHAVVVTKVFEKDGQKYYEVMDTNSQTAGSKTYWKKEDLENSAKSGGIVVLPEKGTVPMLLREPEKKR